MKYLGIDAGGTSCRAIVIDENLEVLYRGQSGGANLKFCSNEELVRVLSKVLADAPVPDQICGCFAGLVEQADSERVANVLDEVAPGIAYEARPDFEAAAWAAKPGDITVLAGTGSVICSKVDDRVYKSGGNGYILGDFGSSFQFGRLFLQLFLESPTDEQLLATVSSELKVDSAGGAVSAVYDSPTPARLLARLAPAFGALCLERTEPRNSLKNELSRLAAQAAKHIQIFHAELRDVGISLAGGLWEAHRIYREVFTEALREAVSNRQSVEISTLSKPPVFGAALMAKHYYEHRIS